MNSHTQSPVENILKYMPIGVALFDAQNFRLLEANDLFHSFLSLARQNGRVIGHLLADWFPGKESSYLQEILRKVTQTGIRYYADASPLLIPERGMTYWNITIDPVWDEEGRIVQLVQVVSEVTTQVLARQQAEQAHSLLREVNSKVEAERRRLAVIEMVASSVRESLDTVCIGKATSDAIYAHFDIACVHIHIADASRQELHMLTIPGIVYRKSVRDHLQTVPYHSHLLIAQAYHTRQPIIVEDIQAAIREGAVSADHPLLTEQQRGYVCIPLWYGDHFEGTLLTIFKKCITPDDPEVQTLIGCGTHIASALAHARLHAAVEHEHARLLAVLDQLPEGVMIVEATDRRLSYANVASFQILGTHATSHLEMPLNTHPLVGAVTYLNNEPVPIEDLPLNRSLRGEYISGRETIVTRPDGSKIVLLTSSAPLKEKNGTITGAVSVFQDITVRKSIEQHKNTFLSIASHELRTPITAMQGFAEILQMKVDQGSSLNTPRSLRAITGIMEQSQRLTRLIEAMLDLSRIEKAQLFINLAEHDILAIISHVLETQTITNKYHHIRFTLEGLAPTDKLVAHIDEDRIDQVLNNLISNAVKYSPIGSEIEVGLRLRHSSTEVNEALIWVRDQGIGIAANELPYIFERFHRASNIDRSISGLGIGLYLVNELVTRHGGRVWVESMEGQGSTFYVSLPLNIHAHVSNSYSTFPTSGTHSQ